jgi:hypothetical protein
MVMDKAFLIAPSMAAAEGSASEWAWTEDGRGWRDAQGAYVEARCNLGNLASLPRGARLYLGQGWNRIPGCEDLRDHARDLGLVLVDPSGRRGLSPSIRRAPGLTRVPATRRRIAR